MTLATYSFVKSEDRYHINHPEDVANNPMAKFFPTGFAFKAPRVWDKEGHKTGFLYSHKQGMEKQWFPTMKALLESVDARYAGDGGIWEQFDHLACELSPENLCCDGELRGRALTAKKAKLDAQWKALEKKLGRTVTEEEVWRRTMTSAH